MTNQGDRQEFFRAISGTATDYNGDFLAAAAIDSFTGEFNGVFIEWLQDRTGSSATNLDGLKQEFAELAGTHNWESTGGVPIMLSSCFLWLDAADDNTITKSSGLVSQWNDKSSNGFNVTQGTGANQPETDSVTQNSLNVLDFDQTDFLIIPSGFYTISNGANTVFCVNKTDDNNRLQILIGTAELGSTRMDLRHSATIGTITYQSRTASGSGVDKTGITETDFNIMMGRRTGTTQAIAFNGGAEATNTNGADEAGVDAASVGGFDESTTFGFDGQIAEIIVYDRSLSAAEITAVNQYLSTKWGITLV